MTAAVIERLFAELKESLVPLMREIVSSPVKARPGIFRGFPTEQQRTFLRVVTERIGFNYRRGRIDVSLHPFCDGSGADDTHDHPVSTRTIHSIRCSARSMRPATASTSRACGSSVRARRLGRRCGHGACTNRRAACGRTRSPAAAASGGSLSRGFARRFPRSSARVSSDELYLAVNAVRPTLIRVDADEVTYNLHIILRFEIEKRLFAGTLAVADLPAAWNALAQELLGLTPANDREGVLQDVHWSGGMFGYFPSYCLGNMMAAQFWYKAQGDLPGLEDDFARGDFSRLLGWLRRNVHEQGRRHDTQELVEVVTGEPLSPKHLLRYLRERYLPLYRG